MNSQGHPVTLRPRQPGNTNGARDGVFSPRLREPRAAELAGGIRELDHVADVDELVVLELGRVAALLETLDAAIARRGVGGQGGRGNGLVDLRLRGSRRLLELAEALALTPRSRAALLRSVADDGLAEEFARRRRDLLGGGDDVIG